MCWLWVACLPQAQEAKLSQLDCEPHVNLYVPMLVAYASCSSMQDGKEHLQTMRTPCTATALPPGPNGSSVFTMHYEILE